MRHSISVRASRPYAVTLEPGLLDGCGPMLGAAIGPCRALVAADSNVAPLYGGRVAASLTSAGFEVHPFTFPAGEQSKNMDTLSQLLEHMAACRLTRRDCVVALGGGVTGDLAGLAAGCYMRGIAYAQLPTSLLAMVDAGVGGKTAVNLAGGKNLMGLFWPPAAVLCDTDCLSTLPRDAFTSGGAEALKTAILAGEPLFSLMESGPLEAVAPAVIAACVAYKAQVTAEDETETGPRRLLNLGHTVGHAIELCSGYRIPHGRAVAAGLAIMTRAALAAGDCDPASAGRILTLLRRLGLPAHTQYSARALAEAALADKKRAGDALTLVWPRAIGDCILKDIPVDALAGLLCRGGVAP